MIDIEKERERTGYKGKPQQWQYGFDLAMSIAQKAESEKCMWRNVQNELWYSECGEEHLLDQEFYETITEHLTYCFKCGKKIEEVSFEESEND